MHACNSGCFDDHTVDSSGGHGFDCNCAECHSFNHDWQDWVDDIECTYCLEDRAQALAESHLYGSCQDHREDDCKTCLSLQQEVYEYQIDKMLDGEVEYHGNLKKAA